MAQLCKRLEKAGTKTVEWKERNHITFNNAKEEAITLTSRRKFELKRRIV